MSNHLAFATVTETLRQMLDDVIKKDIKNNPEAKSVLPSSTNDVPKLGVNVFLYQVSPNTSFRNADLPSRRSDGILSQRPRSAWDLHYLLTFYGKENEQEPQRVMGSVIRALHSRPVITRKSIEDVKQSVDYLATSNLDEEVEQVKFVPSALSLEDLSKIWSVFFQQSYLLSTAYQASVVFIEGSDTPQQSLPVKQANIHTRPFPPPVIEEIKPQFVTSLEQLTIKGRNLKGGIVKVVVDEHSIQPDSDKIQQDKIAIAVPSDLAAGIKSLQVFQELDFGTPHEPHAGFSSNTGVFILRPKITIESVDSANDTGAGGGNRKKGKIEIKFTPKVGRYQQVAILLNQADSQAGQQALFYKFSAPENNGIPSNSNTTETETIEFVFNGVAAGEYFVRVQVDGVESELETDRVSGNYKGPKETL